MQRRELLFAPPLQHERRVFRWQIVIMDTWNPTRGPPCNILCAYVHLGEEFPFSENVCSLKIKNIL